MQTEISIRKEEYAKVFDKNSKIKLTSQLPGKKLYTHKKINIVEHLTNMTIKLKSALN